MKAAPNQQGPEQLIDGVLIDLDEPRDVPPGASGINRRRFPRVAYHKAVRITEFDDFGGPGDSWQCRIVDLSRGGVGLRSRRPVHAGRCVLVEVPGVGGTTRVLFGVVRQSRYAEGEGYAIGVEFKAIPEDHSVRQWMVQRGLGG